MSRLSGMSGMLRIEDAVPDAVLSTFLLLCDPSFYARKGIAILMHRIRYYLRTAGHLVSPKQRVQQGTDMW